MSSIDNTKYKKEVRDWSKSQLAIFKRNIRVLTNKEKHQLIKAIKVRGVKKGSSSRLLPKHLIDSVEAKVRNRFDEPERIVFPFIKHGFFIAVGASRGHSYKTNPRKIIDWYDSSLDVGIEKLADIVVKHEADREVKRAGNLLIKPSL